MMIWGYVLGGQTLKAGSKSKRSRVMDPFPLLRVCRQIYAEAARMPFALNTFDFNSFKRYRSHAKSGWMKHVHNISIHMCLGDKPEDIRHLDKFRTVQIVVRTWAGGRCRRSFAEYIKTYFSPQVVTVRFHPDKLD